MGRFSDAFKAGEAEKQAAADAEKKGQDEEKQARDRQADAAVRWFDEVLTPVLTEAKADLQSSGLVLDFVKAPGDPIQAGITIRGHFNTTTSMGRLTLNVLLSFAQFEREVTSERIRDKIAASKRKGLWVGGTLPLGYEMKDGKIAIVEEEAELVRWIFRRYLELGSVNELVRDLKERNIRTRAKRLATGATRGGIPFGRGALFYLLRNRFYIGEVKYKGEILPGEQPPIMDRALFEAVRQKSLAQWSHRTVVRSKSDHLLTGLLFDDAGHRMAPPHATKAGVRYRYYVSMPFLHGEAKTASAGSVARVPAADIEETIVKCLKKHLAAKQDTATTRAVLSGDRGALAQLIAGIVVHKDRLIVRLESDHADQASDSRDDQSLTIPGQKL